MPTMKSDRRPTGRPTATLTANRHKDNICLHRQTDIKMPLMQKNRQADRSTGWQIGHLFHKQFNKNGVKMNYAPWWSVRL